MERTFSSNDPEPVVNSLKRSHREDREEETGFQLKICMLRLETGTAGERTA